MSKNIKELILAFFLFILFVIGISVAEWSYHSVKEWPGRISQGNIEMNRCITVNDLSSTTIKKYYESFTCGYTDGEEECVHVESNGSSCDLFYPNS